MLKLMTILHRKSYISYTLRENHYLKPGIVVPYATSLLFICIFLRGVMPTFYIMLCWNAHFIG